MDNVTLTQLAIIASLASLFLGYLAWPVVRTLWRLFDRYALPARYLHYRGRRVRARHPRNASQSSTGK